MRWLLIWEIGEDLGHVAPLAWLAQRFIARGDEVFIAVKDLSLMQRFFPLTHANLYFLQAPIWLPKLAKSLPTHCMADILAIFGFLSVKGLTSLVGAWRTLFDLVKHDAVVYDYAPTALLASKCYLFKKIVMGTGFAELEPGQDDQGLEPWNSRPKNIEQRELPILKVVNQVLAEMACSPISKISALYEADCHLLTTLPEVDFRAPRKIGIYIGPLTLSSTVLAPEWKTDKIKIVGYLKPQHHYFKPLLEKLNRLPFEIKLFCPNIKSVNLQLESGAVTLYESPLDLEKLLPAAQWCICHAGNGTVCKSLLAGVPLIMLPFHQEQMGNAFRVKQINAGFSLDDERLNVDENSWISLLESGHYQSSAQTIRSKYAGRINADAMLDQLVANWT